MGEAKRRGTPQERIESARIREAEKLKAHLDSIEKRKHVERMNNSSPEKSNSKNKLSSLALTALATATLFRN